MTDSVRVLFAEVEPPDICSHSEIIDR